MFLRKQAVHYTVQIGVIITISKTENSWTTIPLISRLIESIVFTPFVLPSPIQLSSFPEILLASARVVMLESSDHERNITRIQNDLWQSLYHDDFPKLRYSSSNICTHISRCYFQCCNSLCSCTTTFKSYDKSFNYTQVKVPKGNSCQQNKEITTALNYTHN